MDFTTHYDSPLGGITLACDGQALTGLWFDGQQHYADTLSDDAVERRDALPFADALHWLDRYFDGHEPGFMPPVSLRGTPFQRRIWQQLLAIPYGHTVTYGELAHRMGIRSAQAVGGAVACNPVSLIVPCHRVVGQHGQLTGYAGGLDRKDALLRLERFGK